MLISTHTRAMLAALAFPVLGSSLLLLGCGRPAEKPLENPPAGAVTSAKTEQSDAAARQKERDFGLFRVSHTHKLSIEASKPLAVAFADNLTSNQTLMGYSLVPISDPFQSDRCQQGSGWVQYELFLFPKTQPPKNPFERVSLYCPVNPDVVGYSTCLLSEHSRIVYSDDNTVETNAKQCNKRMIEPMLELAALSLQAKPVKK